MDKAEEVTDALEEATSQVEEAAKGVVQDAIEAEKDGEHAAKFTLDSIGDMLRGVEATLKTVTDDITTLKGTYKGSRETEEDSESDSKENDNAVDFVAPEIEDSPAPPEKEKRGIRARRKKKRSV